MAVRTARCWLAPGVFVISLSLFVWALAFCFGWTSFHFTWGWNKWYMQEYDLGYCNTGLDFSHIQPVGDAEAATAIAQINAALPNLTRFRYEPDNVNLSYVDQETLIHNWPLGISTGHLKFYLGSNRADAAILTVGPPLGAWMSVHISKWVPPAIFFVFALGSGRVLARRYERTRAGRCRRCSYNLTGNTSGACPECGIEIELRSGP